MTAESHSTINMFNLDSVYLQNLQYKFHTYEAWAGLNLSTRHIGASNEFEKLRYLVSARIMNQKFTTKPLEYKDRYYYPYANVTAVLGSISLFRLNYYKTQYIYGFGRKEDIPEGVEASITAGWTDKDGRKRPYFGAAFERYFLSPKDSYFDYSLSFGTSLYRKSLEDISVLANADYFTRLRKWGNRWKQRSFINASFGRQFRALMDEPLFLQSSYGLRDFSNNLVGGYLRATVKGESVFFSPWNLFFFKFAPFVFSSATLFQFSSETSSTNTRFYSALGGGIRTRNESLIFGTIELRASWFPKKDAYQNGYLLQFSTNLRFKYNQQFIRRPEFVRLN